jgi:hypothetical protein
MNAFQESTTPWWIWFTLGVVIFGIIAMYLAKYQKPDDAAYRPHRGRNHRRHGRHRRHRHRGDDLPE